MTKTDTGDIINKLLRGILLDPDALDLPARFNGLKRKLQASGIKAEDVTVGGGKGNPDYAAHKLVCESYERELCDRKLEIIELREQNTKLESALRKLRHDTPPVRRRFRFEKDDVLLAWQHAVDLALKTDLLTYCQGQKVALWKRSAAMSHFTENVWNLKSVSPETLVAISSRLCKDDRRPASWLDEFLKPKAERIVKAPPPRQDWSKLRVDFTAV